KIKKNSCVSPISTQIELLVKSGQLNDAYHWYLSHYRFNRCFSRYPLADFALKYGTLFVSKIIKAKRVDVNDYAIDLNPELVLFWKSNSEVGIRLILKIAIFYLKTFKIPARAILWYARWISHRSYGNVAHHFFDRMI